MLYPKIGIRPVIDGRWGSVRESLENQTMGMAKAAKELIEGNLRYPDGTPIQCVISNTTIGGGAEAAKCAEQFSSENVTATLSVTPCWCYGSETFDMDPLTIKAVWGFNGTERPGAVYLAAVMAAYAQKGLPAFSIYGKDVQDSTDTTIPDDVAEKILRFARCAVSASWMKNKAYVNFGGIAMGIAGSYCNADMFQKYFGIRAEWVDMTEIIRRITLEIYDKDEYKKALAWVKENCKEGFDCNAGKNLPEIITKSKVVAPDKDWEFIVKMTMIMRDILYGNKKLDEMGWHEEALANRFNCFINNILQRGVCAVENSSVNYVNKYGGRHISKRMSVRYCCKLSTLFINYSDIDAFVTAAERCNAHNASATLAVVESLFKIIAFRAVVTNITK